MINIRKGVFETNSSSVHTITICPKDDYDKWTNGEVYFYDGKFITLDKAKKMINADRKQYDELPINWDEMSPDEINDELSECEIYAFDNYGFDEYEFFCEDYTTKSGDTIVAFGYYGHD